MSVRGVRASGDEILFDVHLAPRASRAQIGGWDAAGRIRARVHAAPVDGAANEALRRLIADRLGVAFRDVRLVRGESSRDKTVAVRGVHMNLFAKVFGHPDVASDSKEAA